MNGRLRWILVTVALVAAAGLSAAALFRGALPDSTTARAELEDFRVTVEAPGKLEAAVSFEVGPPSVSDFWNYSLTWLIPEGAHVDEGDVVARFDATQLDDQLRDHRAALEKVLQEKEKEKRNLEIRLKQLRLDLVKAEGTLKTLELDLAVPQELLSSIEVGRLRLERDLASQRFDFLEEKIGFEQELVRAKLELLDVKRAYEEGKIAYYEAAKEKFSVRAPVAGVVVYIPKRNGDRWEIGESVWMLAKLLEVADVSTLRVEADVLEVDAARIAPGQPAEITVDAVPGMLFRSEVSEIGRIVRERSLQDPSKVFDARLPLGDVDTELLRPGMGVQVRIGTDLLSDVVTIPLTAVRSGADGTWVDLASGGGVERRAVTLGASNGERVVVVQGLAAGDRVLLRPEAA